jgi:copper homeostasis protein
MKRNVLLEVCVDSVESAAAAQRGGAHRLELCSAPSNGGVTPSAGLIAVVRQAVSIPLHVIIRPRAGDFCYSEEEFQVMQRDILMAKQLRVDGIVVGILATDGRVDKLRTKQLVDFAAPLPVTFHRAFDMSANLADSLQDLQSIGVARVLTSGGKQTAVEGAMALKSLVAAASETLSIIAASGIRAENVSELLDLTGVREIHATLRSKSDSPMKYRNKRVTMGSEKGIEYQRALVEEQTVRDVLQAIALGNSSRLEKEGKIY